MRNPAFCTVNLLGFFFFCPAQATHLMPLLIASVGAHPIVSTQSVQRYCLLSRNHPESASPRTWTELWPRLFRSSATPSTFSRTPVPPALIKHTHTVNYSSVEIHRYTVEVRSRHVHECHGSIGILLISLNCSFFLDRNVQPTCLIQEEKLGAYVLL